MVARDGKISVLVSKDLSTLIDAIHQFPSEVQKQLRKWTKQDALPVWQENLAFHSNIDQRDGLMFTATARVSVTNTNIALKAATYGNPLGVAKQSLPNVIVAQEFGADPNRPITQKSGRGKPYTRRAGAMNPPRYRKGRVVYPAFRDSVPRVAALWVQTTLRTMHELIEKVK